MAVGEVPAVIYPAPEVGMWCPVPRWNLRHRGANRCKRRSGLRQKCYRHRTARSAQTLDLPDEGRSIPTHPISTVNDLRRWLDDVLDGLGLTGSIAMAGLTCPPFSVPARG